MDSLHEADEYENDDSVALYDPRKGFLDSYKEGDAPKFFGESSAFTFSRALGKDRVTTHMSPGRRPEFWTIPSVSFSLFAHWLTFQALFNLSPPVVVPYPEGTSNVSCVPRTEFDASPSGHVL